MAPCVAGREGTAPRETGRVGVEPWDIGCNVIEEFFTEDVVATAALGETPKVFAFPVVADSTLLPLKSIDCFFAATKAAARRLRGTPLALPTEVALREGGLPAATAAALPRSDIFSDVTRLKCACCFSKFSRNSSKA